MDSQEQDLARAVRGLLVWALASALAVGILILLWFLLNALGIDTEEGVDPRTQPALALALGAAVLMIVLVVFYTAVAVSLVALRPFVSREELRAHFVEQLGSGKVLGRFHSRLFERIFGAG